MDVVKTAFADGAAIATSLAVILVQAALVIGTLAGWKKHKAARLRYEPKRKPVEGPIRGRPIKDWEARADTCEEWAGRIEDHARELREIIAAEKLDLPPWPKRRE